MLPASDPITGDSINHGARLCPQLPTRPAHTQNMKNDTRCVSMHIVTFGGNTSNWIIEPASRLLNHCQMNLIDRHAIGIVKVEILSIEVVR